MGPLTGIRVLEFAAIGPVPFCGMLLSDQGADVIRVDRPSRAQSALPGPLLDIATRGRRSIAIDLKQRAGVELLLELVGAVDVLIEGHRPGVMERLGLGPDVCLERNERLVYGRMTGFGQEGPMAEMAGHDINYIALVGALDAIGTDERPIPPLNLVGDYGGGALYLAFGVLAALVERSTSGHGQVVDAAMVDGAASLMTPIYGLRNAGLWHASRGRNLLDGGAPFYDTYRCADGRWLAVGPLEAPFFEELLRLVGLETEWTAAAHDPTAWDGLRLALSRAFSDRSRDEWMNVFMGSDACVTPVLSMDEAPRHEVNRAREVFVEVAGDLQPAPAPRFSRTPGAVTRISPEPGEHTGEILAELGYTPSRVREMREMGVVV